MKADREAKGEIRLVDENLGTQSRITSEDDITEVVTRIMAALVRRFPVCMASDEFHFFPQARADPPDWSRWDDFSAESIAEFEMLTGHWQKTLAHFCKSNPDPATVIDAGLIQRVLQTLVEQLTIVSPQRSQPTYYLTILGIGLSEAFDHGTQAWFARLRGLPDFLRQARRNLQSVPQEFGRMGLQMLHSQVAWLKSLVPPGNLLQPVLGALSDFETFLRKAPDAKAYLPDVAVFERIADVHMGCGLKADAIANAIEQELDETREILTQAAEHLAPGQPWQKVIGGLPRPKATNGGVLELYRQTIDRLSRHCVDQGILASAEALAWPVKVEIIPEYMRPVRSNAAFSAPPGHPPRGGTFYIQSPTDGKNELPADYRLLAAHETFPGHHLLDSRRWSLERISRRHIEFPIFYEGWASFAEELMFETGFFEDQIDRILLANRRFWRAMRGRVDLEIHMRQRTLDEAAALLSKNGLAPARARAMVKRYILKPGYQLAYTVGRRRFRRLYDQFRQTGQAAPAFARRILTQGEIGFDTLAHDLF